MVTFSENCAPTFRKNVAEADIITSNFFKSLQFFWSQPPLLLLKRVKKGGGCFQWDGCVHFQMIWSGTSCINSKFIRDTQGFFITFLRFCVRKVFWKIFGGYFHWNAWTYIKRICSFTGYNNAKIIRDTSMFLIAFLPFCSRKVLLKSNFFEYLPLKELLVATFCGTCALTSG